MMEKGHVQMAIQAGLELLGPESGGSIPTKLNDGIFFLKQLLYNIGQGNYALVPMDETKKPEDGQPQQGVPSEAKRKAARKKRAKSGVL